LIPRTLQIAVVLLVVAVFGMGLYVLHLKQRTEQMEAEHAAQRPLAPPVHGPAARINIYFADDASASLKSRALDTPLPANRAERDRELLRAVLAVYQEHNPPHDTGAGADVRAVYLIGNDTAIIDMSPQFATEHPSGVLAESLTVASLVQTLAANSPGLQRVKFLVDGRERETLAGHADLASFYDASAVAAATSH
jgi:hypothetical protein